MAEQFAALADLQGERANLLLPPYVPTDRIGINMNRLDRLAQLGGFASGVTISGYYGKTTEYQHEIVGTDNQGTAIAGAAKVKKAELSEADFDDAGRFALLHSTPTLGLKLNIPEMTQRLTESHGKLRDPKAWADQINKGVGDGLRQATWDHYIKHPQFGEIFGNLLGTSLGGFTLERLVTGFPLNNAARGLFGLLERRRPSEICWSLTPGIHPDRALLVSGLSRALKLVKPI